MDPLDPLDAQQIVAEYARLLERDVTENRHPARVDSLPYGKPLIKSAIRTSVQHLLATGQLSDELREYLETAYTMLAEYLEAELVQVLAQYRESAASLTSAGPSPQDKTQSAAWRTLRDSGALAGEVARTVASDAEDLRREFRGFLSAV